MREPRIEVLGRELRRTERDEIAHRLNVASWTLGRYPPRRQLCILALNGQAGFHEGGTYFQFLKIRDLQSHSRKVRKSALDRAALLPFPAPTHDGTPSDAIGCMALCGWHICPVGEHRVAGICGHPGRSREGLCAMRVGRSAFAIFKVYRQDAEARCQPGFPGSSKRLGAFRQLVLTACQRRHLGRHLGCGAGFEVARLPSNHPA